MSVINSPHTHDIFILQDAQLLFFASRCRYYGHFPARISENYAILLKLVRFNSSGAR